MTISQQITEARKAVNACIFGTKEFDAAFAEVKRLVEIQNAGEDNSPMNVILLPSHGQRNYRTIPA